jgi:predicted nucleotidyltransferase
VENPIELERKLKSLKPYLEDEFGIAQIGYFGSFATGNYRDDSDVDILVAFSRRIGWRFFDLKDYLEKTIGRKVDLVTERSLRKQWKDDILSQVRYV